MVIILTCVNKNDGTHRTELLIGCGELEERCIQGHEVGADGHYLLRMTNDDRSADASLVLAPLRYLCVHYLVYRCWNIRLNIVMLDSWHLLYINVCR